MIEALEEPSLFIPSEIIKDGSTVAKIAVANAIPGRTSQLEILGNKAIDKYSMQIAVTQETILAKAVNLGVPNFVFRPSLPPEVTHMLKHLGKQAFLQITGIF
ncbi:MAG: hypothetical protein IPL23_10795 [Saprospiraceae bacterium]|nr:hypothetical protein [Saprospiraceae bacterium]